MAGKEQMAGYRLSDHAKEEMGRRQITEQEIATVLAMPEQRGRVRAGRDVLQSRSECGDPPKTYLLRVFVDTDRAPPVVVTVYRTSNVAKYWRVGT